MRILLKIVKKVYKSGFIKIRMMFEDDNAWKKHYEDWKRVLSNIKVPNENISYEPTIEQVKARVKVIEELIKNYDITHA